MMNKKLLTLILGICFIVLVGAIQITNFYLGEPWDITNIEYDNISFSVNQDGAESGINGYGIAFNTDGTKMYMVSGWNNNIYQYSLSSAWDLSTASYDSVSKSLTSEDTTPNDVSFNTDGTKMFISGRTNKYIYQYSLSTAWNLSTATYDSVNFSISQASQPEGMFFKPDGTKIYTIDYGTTEVYSYILSTAWNLSTATYDSVSYGVSYNYGLCFSNDGIKMYTAQYNGQVVQYILSTAWDISSATYSTSFLSGVQDINPYDISFNVDGTKMYMLGYKNKKVFQYSVGNFIRESLAFSNNQNLSRNITIPYNSFVDNAYLNLSGSEIDLKNDIIGNPWSTYGLNDILDIRGQKIDLNATVDKVGFRWYCDDMTPGCSGNAIYEIRNNDNDILGSCNYGSINTSSSAFKYCDFEPNVTINGTNYITIKRDTNTSEAEGDLTIYLENGRAEVYGVNVNDGDNGTSWSINNGYDLVIDVNFVGGLLYPSTPYIQINNTQIWNHTGEFNLTDDKTSDFASVLNSALNGGNCDCIGCSLSGNTCNISTIFHSDTAGILEYSAIDIQYTPAPFPTLESPANNSYSPANKQFNCSATDEEGLSNITFYFYNSTGDLNLSKTIDISNTYNSTTYDMVFNSTGTWTWGCSAYNNNSRSWWADDNFTINVDIDNPIINLNKPTDLQYINTANTYLNYTPEHSTQTVEVCELYSNFTGTWLINQTNLSITEDIVNTFNQTLSEGYYLWNIKCNTTETSNSAFATSNFTFTIDLTDPTMNNMTITTTADQTQFNFTSNITDTNLDSCKYSVWTGSTPGTNYSFTCNDNIIATAPGFGTYNLVIWATDLASNENSQNLSFTTSISSGGVVTGGGGGIDTVIIQGEKGWTMESSDGQAKFEVNMPKGSKRTFNIKFENLGDESRTITLTCEDIEGLACKYIEFPENPFELALLKDTKQVVKFIIDIPKDAEKGNYQFNIRALDDQERDGTVTVLLGIDTLSLIPAFFSKVLFTKTNFGFPYVLIFFPTLIFSFIIFSKVFKKGIPLRPIWMILSSLSIGILLVFIL